jgi:hypothetical protein
MYQQHHYIIINNGSSESESKAFHAHHNNTKICVVFELRNLHLPNPLMKQVD